MQPNLPSSRGRLLFARFALSMSAIVCAVLIQPMQGQSLAPAGEPSSRYVAIGCVSREAQAPSSRGTPGRARYILTDPRGNRPTVYRLDGDEATLAFHVGHTVEISGPLTVTSNAGPLILKVGSLTYVSTTCQKPK